MHTTAAEGLRYETWGVVVLVGLVGVDGLHVMRLASIHRGQSGWDKKNRWRRRWWAMIELRARDRKGEEEGRVRDMVGASRGGLFILERS